MRIDQPVNVPALLTPATPVAGRLVYYVKADGAIYTKDATGVERAMVGNPYLLSRGMNLMTNGTALLGNNTNFSGFTFDGADTPGGGGGFKAPLNSGYLSIDENIPVDPTHSYTLEISAREKTAALTSYLYLGLVCYDIDGLVITPAQTMYQANTLTTLAAQLNVGDTTVTLTSAANWNNAAGVNSYLRGMVFWNYINARGYAWPSQTYSRNSYLGLYADGGISGNVITLSVPWAGPVMPSGTAVSNSSSGGQYKYTAASNAAQGNVWTKYSGVIGGLDLSGTAVNTKFHPGTAYVKIIVLPNRSNGSGTYLATANQIFANFWFSEAAPAAGPFAPLLMTGVASPSRYVGATSGSPPATGTFINGDFAVDITNGGFFVCTVGGSPGTWVGVGPRSSLASLALGTAAAGTAVGVARSDHVHPTTGLALSAGPFAPTGFTGAVAVSRYVGAVSGGTAPSTGTFAQGDVVVDTLSGGFYVCTVAGTPGTWVAIGPRSNSVPVVDGSASAGVAKDVSRADHGHPSHFANSFMLMGS